MEGYFYKGGEGMAESINIWLAIILTTISIISALIGGLVFIWRAGGKFNSTLSSLNNSIQRLNEHLTRVDDKADKADERLDKHEIRLVKIEHRIGIEAVNDREKEKA